MSNFSYSAALILFGLSGMLQAQYGFSIRFGGRYDDVRMCVATPPGVKGGIAADVSATADYPVGRNAFIHADLPVMRPILFGAAFRMLQFEPTAGIRWSGNGWETGPVAGVSLHYGPDYTSARTGSGRKESFFAAGPIFGAYGGVILQRHGIRIGLSPYVTPLFSVKDPQHHQGIVIGGLADVTFQFQREHRD